MIPAGGVRLPIVSPGQEPGLVRLPAVRPDRCHGQVVTVVSGRRRPLMAESSHARAFENGKGVARMFFLIRRIVRYFQSRKQQVS
jgi:hypothetical protein